MNVSHFMSFDWTKFIYWYKEYFFYSNKIRKLLSGQEKTYQSIFINENRVIKKEVIS